MRKPPYRTFAGLLILGVMMLAALWLCPHDARPSVAIPVIGGLSTLGLYLAGKSAVEHATAKPAAAPTPATD